MINDRETFFKGMEVGRAMRGWRTPDSPSYPSGTKYIYQNGEYDVAQFETASVTVKQTNAISAEQVRKLCSGAAYHFPVFTDNAKSLRVWVEFAEVTEKANGTADKATCTCIFQHPQITRTTRSASCSTMDATRFPAEERMSRITYTQ